MAKVGDKYIITIEQEMKDANSTLYRVKGFKSLVFDDYGLSMLEKVDGSNTYDLGYAAGKEAGWNLARKVCLDENDGGISLVIMSMIFGARNITDILKLDVDKVEEMIAKHSADTVKKVENELQDIAYKVGVSLETFGEILEGMFR